MTKITVMAVMVTPNLAMVSNTRMTQTLRGHDWSRQEGFNLIELMVVIGVIGIVISIGIPAFSEWRERVAIRTLAETIMADVKQARHLAVADNRDVSITFIVTAPYSYTFDSGTNATRKRTVDIKQFSPNVRLSNNFTSNTLTLTSGRGSLAGTVCVTSTKFILSPPACSSTAALGNDGKKIVVNFLGRPYLQ